MILKTELYAHQRAAVEKLSKIKIGALYMEMGTGKTRTALELISQRLNMGKADHVIWLCPFSVKESLRRELRKHTDDISSITIVGIESLSSSIRENIRLLELAEEKRCFLVVDESNLVKNHRTKRTSNIIRLAGKCPYRLILNGTPISRNEVDLFAQWLVLDWRVLGYRSFWSFAANHVEWDDRIPGRISAALNTGYLVKKIAPYSYQIKKSECLDLPSKTYTIEYTGMTSRQWDHYQSVADRLLFEVDEIKPESIYRLFSSLQSVISGFRVFIDRHITREPFFEFPEDNPRVRDFLEVADRISEKAVVFCKYTQEIRDLVEVLNEKHGEGTAVAFYGGLSQKERQENIEKFQNGARFFVANKACAGYGLNLQFANYAIFYSNDWDYATRMQAEDRIHRMGQEKNVHIIDMCVSQSLDERILKCLYKKENMVDSFKKNLDRQKDKKEYLSNWINMKGDVIDAEAVRN
jgi:SNF2 family DNA or RNA helicase